MTNHPSRCQVLNAGRGKMALALMTATLILSSCSSSVAIEPSTEAAPSPGHQEHSAQVGRLGLPLVPWEGGSSYWKQFPKADAAGWSKPGFFPVVAWYDSVSTDSEAQFDKNLGINTYIGMPDTFDSAMFDAAGMFWIGGRLNDTFTPETRSWVGYFLDDEVDGRFTPEDGSKHLEALASGVPEGLFSYANFTYMVLENDLDRSASETYVNKFTDVVSVDKYWYTIPHCSQSPYRDASLVPVPQESCRTASSYGKTMTALRERDATDGKLQPLWQFVENLGGNDNESTFSGYISPDDLQGAVMSSIIHEARGLLYFNQSFTGPCKSSNVFRSAQVVPNFCGASQVEAAKTVNHRIHRLAWVLNTQSLEFKFGDGLDTMLKTRGEYAYIFAMTDGIGTPGWRTLQLPAGISGRTAEVLFERRKIAVDGAGRFADSFDKEFSYHIYKVKI